MGRGLCPFKLVLGTENVTPMFALACLMTDQKHGGLRTLWRYKGEDATSAMSSTYENEIPWGC